MQCGILSASPAAVAGFVEAVQAHARRDGTPVPVVTWPATTPRIAVALSPQDHIAPRLASHPDGSFVVLDGDLYNLDALAVAPGNDRPAADTTAVLDLYRATGPASLARLDCAAAVTIWDARTQELLVGRDRWGQRALFYTETGDRLLWASSVRALLRLGASTEIDADALDFFLAAGYFPAPWTGLARVGKVPPAHVLACRPPGRAELRPFWRGTGAPKLRLPVEQTTERIATLLTRSLRRRQEPGARTGVFLSGGVDSAVLVGLLTRRLQLDVDTFTFQYGGYDGVFNENRRAADTARHFGTRHHVIEFTPDDLAEHLDRMVLAYEEPFTWGLHSYFLKAVAQSGISTVLSGAGVGDWYAGRKDLLTRRVGVLPLPFRAIGRALAPVTSNGALGVARDVALGAATGLTDKTNTTVARDDLRGRVYQDPRRAGGRHRIRSLMRPVVESLARESHRDQIALLTQRYFIAECNLYWYGRWGSAWKLRTRHPYYDNDLQEFVMRLPRPDRDKPEMRRLADQLMPAPLARAAKIAQTVPIRDWFRGPLLGLLRARLGRAELAAGGIFDPEAVHRLIDEHAAGVASHEWLLWSILSTTVWQDTVLRRPCA
jgi:asparagine synthase (glutamine-hydrolysing)